MPQSNCKFVANDYWLVSFGTGSLKDECPLHLQLSVYSTGKRTTVLQLTLTA